MLEYDSYNYYYQPTNQVDSGTFLALGFGFLLFGLLLGVISYVVNSIFLGKIFKKAGVESWIAWVPFYNQWKLLELGGQAGWWAILLLVPVVNVVAAIMILIASYNIGLKLGKSGAFVLWAIFFPIVWTIWLGADSSTWEDSATAN